MLRIESHLPITNHGGVHTYRLGERLNGIQEVSGSIPLISTRKRPEADASGLLCCLGLGLGRGRQSGSVRSAPTIPC